MNNPQAFPEIKHNENQTVDIPHGMTLRDYFAAAVFPAIYREFWISHREGEFVLCDEWHIGIAKDAYQMADAMLAERERGDKE